MIVAGDFLRSRGFRADADADALLAEFGRQMEAGLAGQDPTSLAMIPSYVSVPRDIPADRPVIALDAGGTNLRVALARFLADGRCIFEDYRKGPMPGTNGERLSADGFYAALADAVRPLVRKADAIGFCFSYTAEITPDCDARLLFWTKQVEVPGIVGTLVGRRFRAAIRAMCGRDLPLRIVNDTVAALLAGGATPTGREAAAHVGVVLGTGTNAAYVERAERLARLRLPADGRMAVNIESGNFDGVPPSAFDRAMDAALPDRGAYRFEKMVSGAYLGRLGLAVLQDAAREGLFSQGAASTLETLRDLTTKDLDDFASAAGTSDTILDAIPFDAEDRRCAVELCAPLFERAAHLTAAHIAAATLAAARNGLPGRPVCVAIDGSTYYRTRTAGFRPLAERELRALLAARGVRCDLVQVDDAPLVGAAVIGLSPSGGPASG